MKQKEIKNLAKKLAAQELIIAGTEDKEKIAKAQEEIMKLSKGVKNLDDMVLVDEMVQQILSKILTN